MRTLVSLVGALKCPACRRNDEEGYVNPRTQGPKRLRPDKDQIFGWRALRKATPQGWNPSREAFSMGKPKSRARFSGGGESADGCVSRAALDRIFASACVVRHVINHRLGLCGVVSRVGPCFCLRQTAISSRVRPVTTKFISR